MSEKKLPDHVKGEIDKENELRRIVEEKDFEKFSSFFRKGEVSVLISPPRFFPSLEWFSLAKEYDIWIPVVSCHQDAKEWMSIKLKESTIHGFKIDESFDWIDGWAYGDKDPVLRKWLMDSLDIIDNDFSGDKWKEEAKEIFSIQVQLGISQLIKQSSCSDSNAYVPLITSLLSNSTNRIGTAMVESVQDWPQVIWPNDVFFDKDFIKKNKDIDFNKFNLLPNSPIATKTEEERFSSILDPISFYIKAIDKNNKFNFYLDGACFGKDYRDIYYSCMDYNLGEYDNIVTGDSNESALKSILCDISEVGLIGLMESF